MARLRGWHRVGLAAAGLLLAFAPAGCSAPERRGEVTSVVAADDGRVRVTVRTGAAESIWLVDATGTLVDGPLRPGSTPDAGAANDCAGEVCYRVVAGRLAVERSDDAGRTYAPAWAVSGAAYDQLAGAYPELGDRAQHLSSRSVVVRPSGRGHVVFAANGRDGVLYRDVAGRWVRLGEPQGAQNRYFAAPPPLRPGTGIAWPVASAAGSVVLLAAGITIARRRAIRPVRAALAAAIALAVAAIAYVSSGLPDLGLLPVGLYATVIVLTVTAGGAASAVAVLTGPESRPD